MIHVSSLDDPRLADYRLVADPAAVARADLFVAEGRWVVERLLVRSHFAVRSVLVTRSAALALAKAAADATRPGLAIYVVDQALMDRVVGFNIHRGCLALAERPRVKMLEEISIVNVRRVLVLEGVNNPDNVGGLFRSASAFGVELVILGPASGDPFYRKAIRTSMAATLDVPFVASGAWPQALDTLRRAKIRVIALTPDVTATPLASLPRGDRVALLVGSEGSGLTPAALAHADVRVRIGTTDRVDSLNVTVAASIAMHHIAGAD